MRLVAESIARKTLAETGHRLWIHRFGAVHRDAPRAKIESFDIFVGNFAHAQFVGEIGGCGNRSPMFVKSPEPALRPREKRKWRYHRERHAEVKQREPRADQSHVVIQ